MPALMLALLLSACDLYALDDDTGGIDNVCPAGVTLTDADLPCVCRQDLVTEFPGDVCSCDPAVGLSCTDIIDTGFYTAVDNQASPR